MTIARILVDEHVPGPFVTTLRSLGHDVVRAKDVIEEGAPDERILDLSSDEERTVVTCDTRFAVVGGQLATDHAGVIYAQQQFLVCHPEDAASGVDRITSTVPASDRRGHEFYLSDWL